VSDQCQRCTYRGDVSKCNAADCDIHKTWYAMVLKMQLALLATKLEEKERIEANETK